MSHLPSVVMVSWDSDGEKFMIDTQAGNGHDNSHRPRFARHANGWTQKS